MKTINKEELVEAIARQGCMFARDVERFLDCYEDVLFMLLSGQRGVEGSSSIDFTDDEFTEYLEEGLKIRIANGIYIERKFVPERVQKYGQLVGKTIPEHCNLKAHITPYYADKMNEAIKKEKQVYRGRKEYKEYRERRKTQ